MSSPADYRSLPAVSVVLKHLQGEETSFSEARKTAIVRAVLHDVRTALPETGPVSIEQIVERVKQKFIESRRVGLRPVINATGIVLHTNLGRSVLAPSAAKAAYDAATQPITLEYDLATGNRGHRSAIINELIRDVFGAEQGTAVNNCAAATVITLRALAPGQEVIVSRGQLVEIGGSFRIPEIMAVSGAMLREVGTTNITRIADYEKAIGPQTALLMRIHPSNFRQSGFTQSVGLADLVALGRKYRLPVIDDVGSGLIAPLPAISINDEPNPIESLRAGADLILMSGDKLLGGPQAGIIAGRVDLVRKIERDPFMRAVRCDKMTLAALAETLRIYRDGSPEIPTVQMLTLPIDELRRRAEGLADKLRRNSELHSVDVRNDQTFAGGGSLPDRPFDTVVVVIAAKHVSAEDLARRLRLGSLPVIARIRLDQVLIDLRTCRPDQDELIANAITLATQNQNS